MEAVDNWKPKRNVRTHRKDPGSDGWAMTLEQKALADELHQRAEILRDGSEEGISISEAVELAAFQMGAGAPQVAVQAVRSVAG